jgi:predicted nucleotidyltransferase
MKLTTDEKNQIKRRIADRLRSEPEVDRVVVFGSFVRSDEPNDLDLAVFQHSSEQYLPLATKYRLILGPITRGIDLDLLPIRPNPPRTSFLAEIEAGEVIFER